MNECPCDFCTWHRRVQRVRQGLYWASYAFAGVMLAMSVAVVLADAAYPVWAGFAGLASIAFCRAAWGYLGGVAWRRWHAHFAALGVDLDELRRAFEASQRER